MITGDDIEDIRLAVRVQLGFEPSILIERARPGPSRLLGDLEITVIDPDRKRRWRALPLGDGDYEFVPRIGT